MASAKKTVYHPLGIRGISQLTGRHSMDDQAAWNLVNFRPNGNRLEETPRFAQDFSLNTIFSQAQTAGRLIKPVRDLTGTLKYLFLDQKTARYIDVVTTSTQVGIPCILQTAQPNDLTIAAECLMYGFNTTDFSADADYYEVNTISTTTWQWRKNGGSWSAAQTVLTGLAITANGLYVAFQATTLVAGLTWKWTRSATHPYVGSEATTAAMPHWPSAVYGSDVYIAGIERNVMRVRDNLITSVGYRRVYGKYVCVFKEHLVVGQYAPGVYDVTVGVKDSYLAKTTPYTIGWSHLNNPDQFFASTVNEADSYTIPDQLNSDWAHIGITGIEVWNDVCYIFLADAIYAMVYVGLPTVMRTTQINGAIGSLFIRGTVKTPQGIYFVGRSNIYRLNGANPEPIGDEIFEYWRKQWVAPTNTYFQRTFGFYNAEYEEVCWVYFYTSNGQTHCKMLIYNERSKLWYTRILPNNYTAGIEIGTMCQRYNDFGMLVYGNQAGNNFVIKDIKTPTAAAYKEEYNGTTVVYSSPYVETSWYSNGDIFSQKEIDTMVLDCSASNLVSGTAEFRAYWQAKLTWLGDGNADQTYSTYQGTVLNEPEGLNSSPRTPYRWICYKFQLWNNSVASGTSLAYNGVINGFQENLYFVGNQE